MAGFIGRACAVVVVCCVVLCGTGVWAQEGLEEGTGGPGSVAVLTDLSFDSAVAQGTWLLEFYAPWCGHCKRLEPILEEAAAKLVDQDFRIGKIDATAESVLAGRFAIRGYPTLKFARDGQIKEYTGGRRLEDILEFAKRVSGPPVTEVTMDKLDGLTNDPTFATFLILGPPTKAYNSVARLNQDTTRFLSTNDKTLVEKYGSNGHILAFRTAQLSPELFEGNVQSEESLRKWVDAKKFRLVPELGSVNFKNLVQDKVAVIAVVDPSKKSVTTPYLTQFELIAQEYQEAPFTFSWINGIMWHKFVSQFDISGDDLPTVFVLDHPDIYFRTKTAKTAQDIDAFLRDVQSGKAVPQGEGTTMFGKAKRAVNKFLGSLADFVEGNPFLAIGMFTLPLIALVVWISADSGSPESEAPKSTDGSDDDAKTESDKPAKKASATPKKSKKQD